MFKIKLTNINTTKINNNVILINLISVINYY